MRSFFIYSLSLSRTFALDALVRDYGMASPHAILIEPALFDRRVESSCYRYVERIRRSNSKRKGWAWRNLDEAMAQTSKKSPWKTWHPDVMEWVRVRLSSPPLEDILSDPML